VDEKPTVQSTLSAMNDDTEVDNGIKDNNLDADHNTVEVDNDVDDDNLDDSTPLCFYSINDILGMTKFASRALVADELHVVSSDELTSFNEVERSPSWRKVMMEEMTSIEENGS
jgi:hypothetical protein